MKLLKREFSQEKIEAIESEVANAANSAEDEQIENLIAPLRKRLRHQRKCALSLLWMIECRHLPIDLAVDVVTQTFDTYPDDMKLIAKIGESLEGARDIDQLNLGKPSAPVFEIVVQKLDELSHAKLCRDDKIRVLVGLSTAARMMARQHDDLAKKAYERLIDLEPDKANHHYNYGLFLKTRGFFAEGMNANAKAKSLVDETVDSYEWNFGICATGCGEGEAALSVWKQMGQDIELGLFGLPEGGYPQCKVELAQRPLAQRDRASDYPGVLETIWIERLSPCHGIVRSVLCQDLGVDYGDVVLIDGAPITYHKYGERDVPVFPHLATLQRSDYRFYDFVGTQSEAGQIEDLSDELAEDTVVYSHTENTHTLCASCWRDPDVDHDHHDEIKKHVVKGRIAAPKEISAKDLLDQIDQALASKESCRIYSPELCAAAGDQARSSIETRRYEMVASSV